VQTPKADEDSRQTGKWTTIVFMQGEDADEVLDKMLRFDGHVTYQGATQESVNEALEYLKQWDYGDESEHTITDKPEWGSLDTLIEEGEYVIAYNIHFGYVSLSRKVGAE
jgi:hypothetical protein